MKFLPLTTEDRARWNAFVVANFPAVGAFLQSYEWGDFKEALHGKVLRFAIEENGKWIGCFQLEIHSFPFGLSYGYAPRGPVLRKDLWDNAHETAKIFSHIGAYLKKHFPHLMFVRFEPPCKEHFACYDVAPFTHPSQCLQPRLNQLVSVDEPESLLATLSSDIKHDMRAAKRLEIIVTVTTNPSDKERTAFEKMKYDTRKRSGKNIFPSENYFTYFKKNFHADIEAGDSQPCLCFFIASNKDGVPVAINLNLLFGKTLTYLYGASLTGSISKRAPAYLHWKTIEYAHEHGFSYYDLGGVDNDLWHGLTYFKRQFGGETFEYVGTVDAVLRPTLYSLYNKAKSIRSKMGA